MAFQLSPQQQAVIAFGLTGRGNLNLKARAGCGKTSTLLALVEALKGAFPKQSVFLGAYNKAIATEITAKLAAVGVEGWKQVGGRWIVPLIQSSTMHSAGYSVWKKVAPATAKRDAIDGKKVEGLALRMSGPDVSEDEAPLWAFAVKAVKLAKQRAFGVLCAIEDSSKWFDLFDHFGLDEDLPENTAMEHVIQICVDLYKESLAKCREIIDFDDMILAPLYFNARFFQYDWVLIDEAQDTNPARRALAKKMLKAGGRFIAVGDPAQAIYGFTGADSDSMDIIAHELSSAWLPLTVTYRCPKAIVRVAQQWVPDIQAAETAPEGVVRGIKEAEMAKEVLSADDVILCRNNKPIVAMAYDLIRRGVACRVEGREIGQGLVALISKWRAVETSTLSNKLVEWRDREVQKWLAKGKEDKAANAEDRAETVLVLIQKLAEEGKTQVADLVTYINGLFGDTPEGEKPKCLILSSVHKSKGREWKRVYLLGRNAYMPSKYARKAWQIEQEDNLQYVAVTRAQEELVEIWVEPKAAKERN